MAPTPSTTPARLPAARWRARAPPRRGRAPRRWLSRTPPPVPTPSSNDDENKIRWSFAPRASSSSSSSSSSDDDAAPADASEDDALRARAMALRARAIKSYLALMSVASANLFEKEELAKALADAWIEKRSKTVNLPLRQIVGMPGNPRAGYVVVTLDLPGDAGFVDFLVDSGATTAIVSPRLREMLGASATDGAAIRGLGAMGETVRQKVTIDGVGVGSVRIGALDAVVTDLDASGLPAVVGGLLGLEFLSKFECEFDFTDKALRFHPPGSVACGAVDASDLVAIPLGTHPTGLRTVQCALNGGAPFPGIVDMGSFFSVVNWIAANSGGVSPDSPGVAESAMKAVGIDGRAMNMATAAFTLDVLGAEGEETSLKSEYKGQCCVGDLPAFASLGAETSACMSVGLDVIGRGRTILDVKNDRVYLTPGDAPGGMWSEEEGYGGGKTGGVA